MHRLAAAASKDDVVFVYFAGHGSQVRNSKSDEPDLLDESIVPADSRRGAPDIRDKELRRIFVMHDLLFGETPADEWLAVDEQLALELRERLDALGYGSEDLEQAFLDWAGTENLEERVTGIERVDPVVLAELRKLA